MKINNKLKAFTMAELMVLLLTLSILLAAFSPVFTTRYTNYATNDLWKFVQSDKQYDEYYYVSDADPSRVIIGITPTSSAMVNDALKHKGIVQNEDLSWNENADVIKDSKLILRAGEGQKQMVFLVGNQVKGALFAGRSSIMFGGLYPNNNPGAYNTALGIGALSNASGGSATQAGSNNTALGVASLGNLTSGKNNTAIGAFSGLLVTSQSDNIIVGYAAASDTSGSIGSYNTIVGSRAAEKGAGSYNTFVGSNIAYTNASTGDYNTAVGYGAMNKLSSGYNNTAVGGYSLASLTTGYNNTAVGYGAGASSRLTSGSNKTFIGYKSGDSTAILEDVLKDNVERVFIGSVPAEKLPSDKGDHKAPVAVLEVHNVSNSNSIERLPIKNVTDASVVINGNLIVRGNTYLEIPILRPKGTNSLNPDRNINYFDTTQVTKGLVLHTVNKIGKFYSFSGKDGVYGNLKTKDYCNDDYRTHDFNNVHESCICTIINTNMPKVKNTISSLNTKAYNGRPGYSSSAQGVSTSYDWYSNSSGFKTDSNNKDTYKKELAENIKIIGDNYTDLSTNTVVYSHVFFQGHGYYQGKNRYYDSNETDRKLFAPYIEFNKAHPYASSGYWPEHSDSNCSCCPMLNGGTCSSDRRLKNVGEKFTAGLDELKKLNIYNFTFKNDANKAPHVGVIAQDLKRVFPNAVTKGENGFYQIRWEEMFYAMINAVKDINNRVTALATRVSKDKERIANLKKDNQALNAQLDKLVTEVEALEAKRK